MSSTTWKRWVILIVVLILIAATLYSVQQFQVSRLARSVAGQADAAAQERDHEKAAKLYAQHLAVVPEDTEIKFKYANMLVQWSPSPQKQLAALKLYGEVLRQLPGREDVRRKQMELKFAMGQLRDAGAEADLQILLNLPQNKTDGDLWFMMGRCREDAKNDVDARTCYETAINHNAPQKIDAYERLAFLLRSPNRVNDPKAGDSAVDEMVRSAPDDYHVYLARARYRRQFGLPDAKADIEKALKLAGDRPEIVLEMADAAGIASSPDEARRILEAGLTKSPGDAKLYQALAELEIRSGHMDKAIDTLDRGLKSVAKKDDLQWMLANYLATRGDTGKLLLQIEELKKLGFNSNWLQFLRGYYYVNASRFREARQVLAPLESATVWPPQIKARIGNLLARCYGQLGEPEMQQEAYVRALSASPQDVHAKIGLIERMVKKGDIDEAIKGYRALVGQLPAVRLPLARLLLLKNRQLPEPQRRWDEIESLVDAAEKSSPDSVEPLVFRADLAEAQGKRTLVRDLLEKTRTRFPKNVAIWSAQVNLLLIDRQFDEASRLLDQARKELGDSVDLRLESARLAVAKGGPQVVASLNALSENVDLFSKVDRFKLLSELAMHLARLSDPAGARRLWSRLADQEPNDIDLRLKLFELAVQTGDKNQIESIIKQIEQIEGKEGSLGAMCQARYLVWQAGQALEKDPQEALRARTKARVLLNELASRRADLPAIPVALAELEQQELRKGGLTPGEIDEKEESIIRSFRRAIDLGQRNSALMRETVRLLFKHKRGSEALELVNSIPVESQLAGNLGRQAISDAVGNRDFEHALELARKAVAAKPADFQERVWLVQILLSSGKQVEAEHEIREAVNLSKSDPERWIMLVKFLVTTKQTAEAEKVISDVEANVPPLLAPLALAQCSALLGRAYDGVDDGLKKKWYARAKGWYERAQSAQPDDLQVARTAFNFFVQTNQMAEAEAQLDAIVKRGANARNEAVVGWARRTLSLALASPTDRERARRALAIMEPNGPVASPVQGSSARPNPDDLRTLARVLEAQRTVPDRQRAIDLLEMLVAKNLANLADRLFLANLLDANGDWPKALAVYRELNGLTKNARDLETLSRRPAYLSQFAKSLLRNHKAGNQEELTEAQDLVDELAKHTPNALDTIVLQVDVYLARKQPEKAVELIQASAHRPNLAPAALKTLGSLAEKLDRIDLAEPLYRQYAALPNQSDGAFSLAGFLGRQGRVGEALDVLAPRWAQGRDVDAISAACLEVLSSSGKRADPLQIDRIAGWFEDAIKQKKSTPMLLFNLANVRSDQMRYDESRELYQSVINHPSSSSLAPTPMNRLIALACNNSAWLTAVKGGEGKIALAEVNRAIKLIGPQADLLDTRAMVYLSMKQTPDAINDLQTAVKDAPSPNKFFHLAQAYFQANDKEKAKQYLKEARARGLDDRNRTGPGTLHALEQPAYQKLLSDLGQS
jgi:cellulose synthase operon protein C